MPFLPPRFEEIGRMKPLEMYGADFLTVPPNLTGMPNISLPCAYVQGLPVGMQLIAPALEEKRLLSVGRVLEANAQREAFIPEL